MSVSPYDRDLDRNPANFRPLTPLSFLARAAGVYPDKLAIYRRCCCATPIANSRALPWRLADALRRARHPTRRHGRGDGRQYVPALLEAHFGVPMSGAVLNALNTRLDARSIAFMIDHGEAKALVVDREFAAVVRPALELESKPPPLVENDDPETTALANRSAAPNTRPFSARATRLTSAPRPATSGTRSRSTTLRARPASPRASSTTIAAPS